MPQKTIKIILSGIILILLQNCSVKKKTVKTAVQPVVQPSMQPPAEAVPQKNISFTKNILPILTEKCTPCHFPPDGNVEALNTYPAVKAHIRQVIERVKLPKDNYQFMPYNNSKPALTSHEIKLLEEWQKASMPE